jgi:triacylglycerol lipase
MPLGLKSRKIIFVHGIFGWGESELPFSYWGEALAQFKSSRFEAHEVKCGPVSSFHDRACEVFAQIKGGDFIYENAPGGVGATGKRSVVPRDERKHVAGPLLADWSANNPVILVGHSAGAHTCLALQRLLKDDHFGVGSNPDWVEAVICISGVLNGSTLAYGFGCDPVTGILTRNPERLIRATVDIADRVPTIPLAGVDRWLEQWKDHTDAFVRGKDNLAYDLTLSGCHAANAAFSTNPNSYYLSLVTSIPAERPNWLGIPLPRLMGGINFLLEGSASYQADIVNFVPGALPLPNWGATPELQIDAWRENDGAVSAISQRFPFTHHREPFGREGFFDGAPLETGKWYFERVENVTGKRFDHLDPGFGARMKWGAAGAQRELYQKLAALL